MKIGVLTLPFNNNYGGLLQSYALQTFLKQMGHEVILIQRQSNPIKRSFLGRIKRFVKILIGKERQEVEQTKVISANMEQFFKQHMTYTPSIFSDSQFELIKSYKFDAIVVGSDQVWRFDYTRDRFQNYFLDFTKGMDLKRIAYAASFGIDTWNIDESKTKIVKSLIANFDAVSVRESSGVDLCREVLDAKAELMLDPAFLLEKQQYHNLFSNASGENKGKLLVYFLDRTAQKDQMAQELASELKTSAFTVGAKDPSKNAPLEDRMYPPVSKWLEGFADAKFVITDSYHGCVFAIIFNKPFFVIGNRQRGMARFDSVLELFDLKDRLVDTHLPSDIIQKEIDYEGVNQIIGQRRLLARKFLEQALNN